MFRQVRKSKVVAACMSTLVVTLLMATLLMAKTAGASMRLEVDVTDGQITWINDTDLAFHIDYYEITSASGSLNPADWSSLQEQDLDGFPAGDGTGNGWEQAGGSSAKVLGESFPLGQSTFPDLFSIDLGMAFNVGGTRDLEFRYAVVPPSPVGDYNDNNIVDAADYTMWRDNLGASVALPNDATLGAVTSDDYSNWMTHFGAVGEIAPASMLVAGVVEYFPAGAASSIPEPKSTALLLMALMPVCARYSARGRKNFLKNRTGRPRIVFRDRIL